MLFFNHKNGKEEEEEEEEEPRPGSPETNNSAENDRVLLFLKAAN